MLNRPPGGDTAPVTDLDRRYLAAAIRLGLSAQGLTFPNPSVGAILVKDGKVVGRGRTAPGGRPHAETVALDSAGTNTKGATLYVSLEPCAHHGRTPPCADAIIAAGAKRVVAGMRDPDPRVSGRGIADLRDGGLDVAVDAAIEAARTAHIGHIRRMESGRPHVVLKMAISADGFIGRSGAGQVAITGETARRHVQALRSRFDAIVIGAGTAEADDPQLTCRLPGLQHRSPIRIVIAGQGGIRPDLALFSTDSAVPTWVVSTGARPDAFLADAGANRIRWLQAPGDDGQVDLAAALQALGEAGLTRIMVEGGSRLAGSLLAGDLIDEAMLFRSPSLIGARGIAAFTGQGLAAIENDAAFDPVDRRRFGEDRMTRYLRMR
ncbi:MAG: bifunctional diaminohydroxyphosphoribosylaminopyrimidine deaminase/5-amino-6-(5-phosphoribosylamino)uracil reductase RibD [Hyphomicrobiales bacterium]|nr:bifunctional diaminohydroxyphosphoribosylaminopyrimidine deaminase/5-amino-6-(5-phosphoribosylamino)uracil reductase RibD [Hyphomicrobiales bacterium]